MRRGGTQKTRRRERAHNAGGPVAVGCCHLSAEEAAAAGEDSGVKMTRAATEEGPRGGAALFGLAGVYVHDVLAVVG